MTIPGRHEGGALELAAFDGKHFQLVSEQAFAPGQPLRVEVELGDGRATLELKSLGSVRRSDGRFDVRARAQTLTRLLREQLTAALAR